jgi:regulator of nucleoside diphosphate kinase
MPSIFPFRVSPPASAPWRTVTELDRVRIHRWLRDQPRTDAARALGDLVDNADEVAPQQVPDDVVTMYSQVLLSDSRGAHERKLTLCYPPDAEPMAGFVSVFSPVGAALLGLRVGEAAAWSGPDGKAEVARVKALLFQPEASGDFTM